MILSLLVFLVILGVVAYLVTLVPMDGTIQQLVRAVFIVIAVIACLDALGLTHFGIMNILPIR